MQDKDLKLGLTSLLTALLVSSCCILPFLAAIGATSGALASRLQFLEPFRPFFTLFTIGLLGLAWGMCSSGAKTCSKWIVPVSRNPLLYQKVTNKFRSVPVLTFVTVLALLMVGFPYYSPLLMANESKTVLAVPQDKVQKAIFYVQGMTCEGCEVSIAKKLKKWDGVLKVNANYEKGTVYIEWEKDKASIPKIIATIEALGYKVADWDELTDQQ